MKIQEIYEKYQIMPQLQIHMLRAAGVAYLICDNFNKPLDNKLIISAALLHDMGNMVRIDLEKYPKLRKGLDMKYWKRVQKNFISKYGLNEYITTGKILKELNLSEKIINIVDIGEVINIPVIEGDNNTEIKIFIYSDTRVSPYGVTSLSERLSEVKDRFIVKKNITEEYFEDNIVNKAQIIEHQIFSHCKIKPEDVTEEKVQPLLEQLRNYDI